MRTPTTPPERRFAGHGLRATALAICGGLLGTAWAGATASSFKKETKLGANYWNAQSVIDGDLDTAWQVPGESPNRGEWLMLDVPKCTVDKLALVVGWAKDADHFADYARIKEVQIEVFSYDDSQELVPIKSHNLKFEDKMEEQVVDFEDVAIDDMFGGKVKISVVDIYPGKDFPNLAVSELVLHLAEFDAAPVIQEVSGEDKPRESLVDDNNKTYWAAPSKDATISFEASGYSLSKVGIVPGPKDYDRPKKVEIIANGRSIVHTLPDKPGAAQWVLIPAVTGYTGSAFGQIQLKVLEVYPGSSNAGKVAIGELDVKATAYEGL